MRFIQGKPRRYIRKNLAEPYKSLARFSAPLRSEPQFLVIGTQKGGTSSIYENLTHHPQIVRALTKELHFFDGNFEKGWDWYHGQFPVRFHPKALATRLTGRRTMTGEATPSYLFFPHVAERIAQCCPKAKFIALLRNPVSRAYSQLQMEIRGRQISRIPGDPLVDELRFLQKYTVDRPTYERFFYDYASNWATLFRHSFGAYPYEQFHAKTTAGQGSSAEPYMSPGFMLYGFYYEQLKIWFEHFPREQLLVLKSEDYFADPARLLKNEVRQFLELSDWEPHYVTVRTEKPTYSKPIDPGLAQELAEYFKPYNEKLYNLLGVDFGW